MLSLWSLWKWSPFCFYFASVMGDHIFLQCLAPPPYICQVRFLPTKSSAMVSNAVKILWKASHYVPFVFRKFIGKSILCRNADLPPCQEEAAFSLSALVHPPNSLPIVFDHIASYLSVLSNQQSNVHKYKGTDSWIVYDRSENRSMPFFMCCFSFAAYRFMEILK